MLWRTIPDNSGEHSGHKCLGPKTKEVTRIQQTILALHMVEKEGGELKGQVYIIKLILKGIEECYREMECQREPTAAGREEAERKLGR